MDKNRHVTARTHTQSLPIARRAYDTHKKYCVVITVDAQQHETQCGSVYSHYRGAGLPGENVGG